MRNLLYILLVSFILAFNAAAQSPSSIKLRCPSPFSSIYGQVFVTAGGDIFYKPCPADSSVFYYNVDFSNATVTGLPFGNVSGTGTTNFIPRWTNGAGGVIGNTPFSWNGTTYKFDVTALNCTFCLSLNPNNAGGGLFSVGSTVNSFSLGEFAGTADVTAFTVNVGDTTGAGNATKITVDDTAKTTTLQNGAGAIHANTAGGTFTAGDFAGAGNFSLLTVDDTAKQITLNTTHSGLQSDGTAETTIIGDYLGGGASTGITITDGIGRNIVVRADNGLLAFAPIQIGSTLNPFSTLYIGSAANQTTQLTTSSTGNRVVNFSDASGTVLLDNGIFTGIGSFSLFRTITPGGTTGAQTINKPAGSVNFAGTDISLTVTNNTVNTSSLIFCTIETNDTTMKSVQCVPGAGSFVIFPNAAPTAETKVAFWVTN